MESMTMFLVWIGISIVGLTILLWFCPCNTLVSGTDSGVRISLLQLVLMRWEKFLREP
jgi:uncharacterized protein YqfA (UPF0365 family)